MAPQGILQKRVLGIRLAAIVALTVLLLFSLYATLVANHNPLDTTSEGSSADVSNVSAFFQSLSDKVGFGREDARLDAIRSEMSDMRKDMERLRTDQVGTRAAVDGLNQTWGAFFASFRGQGGTYQTGSKKDSLSDMSLEELDKDGELAADELAARAAGENELPMQSGLAGQALEAQKGGLRQCTSGTLLGSWRNSSFVPLPYDAMQVFLDEAEGSLSPERTAGLEYEGDDFGSVLDAFPDLVENLTERSDGQLHFQPPCFYHFYSKEDILRLFAGKWVFFIGDSNTRALCLGLLTILDPTHNQPYSDTLWFNGTGEWDEFPHIAIVDYFFRGDGSILFKTARDILNPDKLPTEPYSVRISYRMREDVGNVLQKIPETIGEKDWQPDLLYFNSGSWDAFFQDQRKRNWTETDRMYGVLMDHIASTCDPQRQVCVWGTLTSNVGFQNVLYHSRFALMQWRHIARIMRAQVAGASTRLHFLDRFWSSHVSDQRRGGHYGHMVNIWDAQRLFNVYEGIMAENFRLGVVGSAEIPEGKSSGERLAERRTRIGRKPPQCEMRVEQGHVVRAECDWFPERVTFAEGCVLVPDEVAEQTHFSNYTMWEANCEAKVD
ncbi:hypothetical protein KFL_003150060 [Klebsormidium nitens]|uniref:Uncharacterized protein n=1 Tax=Klebsormidium nitens TaxID=105231 RepID=A0A1Y1ICL9_KLENI|nr:hypothetical protein KFL_003150060 [Klebsormidium nitens]|eukprot:GAQ86841.1 hypothetical protein KFL_003150060 [Klebsormidium nitens]